MTATTTDTSTEAGPKKAAPKKAAPKKAAPKKAAPKKPATEAPARKALAKKVVTPAKVAKRREVAAEKAEATAAHLRTALKRVPVDRIDRDPTQPREHFDQAKLDELAGSMKELGQLQPVSVRYVPSTRRYTLIMGERRWRAAKIAGLTELDAVVVHGVQEGARETLAKAVAENVGRADMTPVEEAKAFKRLMDADYTLAEVASMCGKSEPYIGWRVDLLKLCEAAQDALGKGHLPIGVSWYVASLSHANQMRFLAKWTRGDFGTKREAEAFAQACRAEEERQQSQGSFFVLADETEAPRPGAHPALPGSLDIPEEEREQIIADRQRLTKKIDRLSAAGEILHDLIMAEPEELALLLAGAPGGVGGYRQRLDHMSAQVMKAVKNMRQAQAIAAVRAGSGIEINPEAAADAA